MDRTAGHLPVLPQEVSGILEPQNRLIFLDCTVGLGGHAKLLLEQAPPHAQLIGIDVDQANLRQARENLAAFGPRVRLFQANFSQTPAVLAETGVSHVDAMLADLGIASTQLDDPARGLSFMADGPLDMRLDDRISQTAADLVNSLDETRLADLIFQYGEERYSRRIARAIVNARRQGRIERTSPLAQIIASAMPAPVRHSRTGVHPATRTFQALRIAVNDELGNLQRLLDLLPGILSIGGRAAVISFHSLEDRLVKRKFSELSSIGTAKNLSKKPINATDDETHVNPRSRSAKLRGIERIS
jgi:16S rRNA (cytosine1402-N4)-methyltransferase